MITHCKFRNHFAFQLLLASLLPSNVKTFTFPARYNLTNIPNPNHRDLPHCPNLNRIITGYLSHTASIVEPRSFSHS